MTLTKFFFLDFALGISMFNQFLNVIIISLPVFFMLNWYK